MKTHLGQTILFYPGSQAVSDPLGTDPIPAVVIQVHSQNCINLEILTGTNRGLQFTSVTHSVTPETEGFCWHQKEVLVGEVLIDPK